MLLTVILYCSASTAALAQAAPQTLADKGDASGEIIVTAQKRSENIQKVPIAISALPAARRAVREPDGEVS